jgi:hypothetical protein
LVVQDPEPPEKALFTPSVGPPQTTTADDALALGRPGRDPRAMVGEHPRPPFRKWPVQIRENEFGFAWYVEPAAFVLQSSAEHGTVAFAERFSDLIDHLLDVRREPIREAGGLLIFHDWRSLGGYDKEARTVAVRRMKAREPGYARRTIVAVSPQSRLLRMAVEAVNLFAALTLKSKIELVTDPSRALAEAGLAQPAQGIAFP